MRFRSTDHWEILRVTAQCKLQAEPAAEKWRDLVANPEWAPHAYDARGDTLRFAHLPREVQRRAVFLDPRFVADAPYSDQAPVAELPAAALAEHAGPLHFIFHTAFCCSTLLTRALDIPGVSMGLKEPGVLTHFAYDSALGRQPPGALAALGVTLDLLSRPLAPGETQIVKPSNTCNHLIPQMMHLRPDAKAIVLYSSLEAFLAGIVRRGQEGREYARRAFHQFLLAIPLETRFSREDLQLQTDLQIAAQVWLMQAAFLDSVARRLGSERVRVLNCADFLANKSATLSRVSDFFGLGLDDARCAEIARSEVFKEHAKNHAQSFDPAQHQAQLEEAAASHAEELASARDWARALARRSNAPLVMQDTLLT